MNIQKQVDKDHYAFEQYMQKCRWNSMWHQLDEVIKLKPDRVLEIGPGPGVFKNMANLFGVKVETLDLDPDLNPDHIGSATSLPFPDNTFDVVCAFQMLEHLPYETSLDAFREMARVARKNVIISLPDSKTVWPHSLHVPRHGAVYWLMPRPFGGARQHKFDGQHYWEINKRGFALQKVVTDLSSVCDLIRTYRVNEHTYHRFFIFSVR